MTLSSRLVGRPSARGGRAARAPAIRQPRGGGRYRMCSGWVMESGALATIRRTCWRCGRRSLLRLRGIVGQIDGPQPALMN